MRGTKEIGIVSEQELKEVGEIYPSALRVYRYFYGDAADKISQQEAAKFFSEAGLNPTVRGTCSCCKKEFSYYDYEVVHVWYSKRLYGID